MHSTWMILLYWKNGYAETKQVVFTTGRAHMQLATTRSLGYHHSSMPQYEAYLVLIAAWDFRDRSSVHTMFSPEIRIVTKQLYTSWIYKWRFYKELIHHFTDWPPLSMLNFCRRPVTRTFDVFISGPEQTVEQTTETLVTWDAIALIMTSL